MKTKIRGLSIVFGSLLLISLGSFILLRFYPTENKNKEYAKTNILAFYSYANETDAWQSLQNNAGKITIVSPSWYRYDTEGAIKGRGYDPHLADFAKQQGILLIPLLTNYDPELQGPSKALAKKLLTKSDLEQKLLDEAIMVVKRDSLDGINLDLENIDPALREELDSFAEKLYQRVKKEGKYLVISLPAKTADKKEHSWVGAFDYEILAKHADLIVVMAYNESWTSSPPGPILSNGYCQQVIDYVNEKIPKEKVIFGIPVYGIVWDNAQKNSGKMVSYGEIQNLLNGTNTGPKETRGEMTFRQFKDSVELEAWFENAKTILNKLDYLAPQTYWGIALWSLGREDPQVWNTL